MDAYLQIAEAVLRTERRPLSPHSILAAAYRYGIVPPHLYGKTQHKTLAARISEDIVQRREKSLFFRPAPGRFFIREYLADPTIPEEYRQPVATRRRLRELMRGPALSISVGDLQRIANPNTPIDPRRVFDLLQSDSYRYDEPREKAGDSVFVWSFVSVRRSFELLTYRVGRFRDNRDSFMARRSIGFKTLVHRDERTLFNFDDFGIIDSGVHAAKIDLDIPEIVHSDAIERSNVQLLCFLWVAYSSVASDLLAVINFECPNWFEPTKRRLALNDLAWLDTRLPINNIEDFDPWSKSVLIESSSFNSW